MKNHSSAQGDLIEVNDFFFEAFLVQQASNNTLNMLKNYPLAILPEERKGAVVGQRVWIHRLANPP